MKLGYEIRKGVLGLLELVLYDLDNPIQQPTSSKLPPYFILETHVINTSAQGVTIARRRGAVPITETGE